MLVGLDCVTNRWEAEADAVSTLAFAFNHLSVLAQDLIQFSSPMLGYLKLPAGFTTGSSIMPQKMNPDFAEVTRAKASVIHGSLTGLLSLSKGMVSGYNRDTQWSKYLAMDAFGESDHAMEVFARALQGVKPDRRMMYAACKQGFMNSVELADMIARDHGVDFRTCYKIVGRAVKDCDEEGELTLAAVQAQIAALGLEIEIGEDQWAALSDPMSIVNMRRSDGSPAIEKLSEAIEQLREQLSAARRSQHERASRIQRALHTLRKIAHEIEAPESV
jgi:argininosuccinate lyase